MDVLSHLCVCACVCVWVCIYMYMYMYMYVYICIYIGEQIRISRRADYGRRAVGLFCKRALKKRRLVSAMGWLRSVGSWKVQVSFAEYRLFYTALLQKRPTTLRSLLIVATPYEQRHHHRHTHAHTYTHTHTLRHRDRQTHR